MSKSMVKAVNKRFCHKNIKPCSPPRKPVEMTLKKMIKPMKKVTAKGKKGWKILQKGKVMFGKT